MGEEKGEKSSPSLPTPVDSAATTSGSSDHEKDATARSSDAHTSLSKTTPDETTDKEEKTSQPQDASQSEVKAKNPSVGVQNSFTPPPPPPPQYPDPGPPRPPPLPQFPTSIGQLPPKYIDESLANYNKRAWSIEIDRASRQDWRKREWHNLKWPMPIIQAFYLQVPGVSKAADEEGAGSDEPPFKEAEAFDDLGELKNLQRIAIHSEYLHNEILSITRVLSAQDTIFVAPPYKLLMRAFPEIQTRLVKLKKELEEANAQVRAEEEAKASEGKSLKETEPSSETPAQDKATEKCDGETPDAQVEIPTLAKEPATKDKATSVSSYASSVASSEGDYFTNETERRDRLDARYTHLKCLHDFMTTELGDLLELRKRIADGTQKDIEFEDLWHLYAPGDVIYSNDNGYHQLYKVYFVSGGQSLKRTRNAQEASEINNMRERLRPWVPPELREDGEDETLEKLLREESSGIGTWTAFKVDCYSMAFDGEYCGPIDVCKKIQPYGTPREITSLPMFPLRFHPRKDELLRELEDRGRRFLFAGGHKSYDGRTIALKRIDSRVEIQSDVYVDFDAYYQDNTSKKPELGKLLRSRQNWAEVQEAASFDELLSCSLTGHEIDSKLSDDFFNANRLSLERFKPLKDEVPSEFLCLMPHYVVGYVFQLREWHHLDLDLIKDIDRDSADARAAGFEDLVIPKRYRDLLVALVDSHASGLQRGEEKKKHASVIQTQIDLVRGKGQGLIILLHGPPGSGKTSTAETIAAYTRRPLYSITCGDIGMTPDVVEKNLLDHTRRADRWGCVLLLDEADVFLVQRDWDSLTRNALVSVFLRQLEYYAGILFLTTNRIGVIDEAFKSRVHISLRYPGVDLESTKIMWSNIMARIEKDNKHSDIQIVFDKEALLEFASKHFEKCRRENVTWNGRQIRNAFQTALALGHYERFDKIREAGMTPEEALATGKKKWRTVKLTKANFQNIAKTAKEFEQYIATVRGSDSMNAQELELRRDNYDPERPQARKQYPSSREAVRDLQSSASASRSKGKRAAKVELPSEDEEDESDSEDLSPEEDD